jgi:hypothetical protein
MDSGIFKKAVNGSPFEAIDCSALLANGREIAPHLAHAMELIPDALRGGNITFSTRDTIAREQMMSAHVAHRNLCRCSTERDTPISRVNLIS